MALTTTTNVVLTFGENDTPNPRNAIIIIRSTAPSSVGSTGPSSVVKSVDATNHDIEVTVNVSQAISNILGLPALTNDVRIFPNPASTHLYIRRHNARNPPYHPYFLGHALVTQFS